MSLGLSCLFACLGGITQARHPTLPQRRGLGVGGRPTKHTPHTKWRCLALVVVHFGARAIGLVAAVAREARQRPRGARRAAATTAQEMVTVCTDR